jgi:hypothetical protein
LGGLLLHYAFFALLTLYRSGFNRNLPKIWQICGQISINALKNLAKFQRRIQQNYSRQLENFSAKSGALGRKIFISLPPFILKNLKTSL